MSWSGDADLQKRVRSWLERHADVNRGRAPSRVAVLSIVAVCSVRAVSARRRIIRVHGTGRAGDAVQSVRTTQAVHSMAAGKIGDVSVVVANRNIEFGAQIGWLGTVTVTCPTLP